MKQWELRGVTVDREGAGERSVRSGDGLDPLRILMNQVPALFWTTDADLVLTSSLGAEFERLGLGPNQLVGTALAQLFESEKDGDLIRAHHRALAGSSVQFGASWARRSFRARVAPLRDSDGQVIGTICVAVSGEETRLDHEASITVMKPARASKPEDANPPARASSR
jgi:PAS domain-containing protein